MKAILTILYNLVASMHPLMRGAFGVFAILLAINKYVNALWSSLFARLDAMMLPAEQTADFGQVSLFGLINYVFPLDTVLSFITAYAALRATCAAVRIIKSFIPTIS